MSTRRSTRQGKEHPMAGMKRRRQSQAVAKAALLAACQTTTEETRNQQKGCSLEGPETPNLDDITNLPEVRLKRQAARKRRQKPQAADDTLTSAKKARISPATSTSPQRGSKLVKRTMKQIAAQQLADALRKNADLLRQIQEANAYNKRLSEAAEAEVVEARERNASLTQNLRSLELQKQDLLKKFTDKDKELIGAEARITDLQQEVARLHSDKAMLQSLLGQKSGSLDSGASEALHTAQASSEAAGAADQIRGLQEEVARLQHDKSLMQNRLTDMGIELEEAEARADRLMAVQEHAKLPCFPAGTSVQVHEALGMGSSGTVLKATLTQRVAIKRANRQAHESGEEEGTPENAAAERVAQDNVDFEARMLAMFKGHPDIVQALGLIQEAGALGRSIVLELASHGSLARFLSHIRAHKVEPDFVLQLNVARSCASGLQHIHDRGMCHNDFKPDNVLVFFEKDGSCSPGGSHFYSFRAKVADLGLLAECDRHTGRLLDPWMAAGTKGYQHPGSLLDPATAGFADDRYAYGVMLWEMLCGQSAREHLADQLEALEDLQPQQWAVVAAELARRGWDKEDLDACVAAAHAFGFISLEEILLDQGMDVPSEYMDLVRRLVSVDPRSEGPAWCKVLDTLDRLLRAAA